MDFTPYLPYILIALTVIFVVLLLILREAMKRSAESYPPGTVLVLTKENQDALARFLFGVMRGGANLTKSPLDNNVIDLAEELYNRDDGLPIEPFVSSDKAPNG